MIKNEKANAVMVLKRYKGDYVCIDFLTLPSSLGINAINIEEIDNYTKNYYESSIIREINKVNIVSDKYKNSNLEILTDNNTMLPILSKDIIDKFNLNGFIESNINNKQMMNTIYNYIVKNNYLNKELNQLLNNSIKLKELSDIIIIINLLSYMEYRYLYFYLYKKYVENKKENILNRERKQD